MTTLMTIALLFFLGWGCVQIFRWTFSDKKDDDHHPIGPYHSEDWDDPKNRS